MVGSSKMSEIRCFIGFLDEFGVNLCVFMVNFGDLWGRIELRADSLASLRSAHVSIYLHINHPCNFSLQYPPTNPYNTL